MKKLFTTTTMIFLLAGFSGNSFAKMNLATARANAKKVMSKYITSAKTPADAAVAVKAFSVTLGQLGRGTSAAVASQLQHKMKSFGANTRGTFVHAFNNLTTQSSVSASAKKVLTTLKAKVLNNRAYSNIVVSQATFSNSGAGTKAKCVEVNLATKANLLAGSLNELASNPKLVAEKENPNFFNSVNTITNLTQAVVNGAKNPSQALKELLSIFNAKDLPDLGDMMRRRCQPKGA